jgi:23S rRNA pseudouridine2605 synthase
MAACGIASRRASEIVIRQGNVSVNGQVVTTLGMLIDPEKDVVTVGQRTITPQPRRLYLALNKPEGYIVSLRDTHGRPTVQHLICRIAGRLFPVGRLDMNSEGLLLMTNDGELAYRLTHPRFGIEKEYRVTVQGKPDAGVFEHMRRGIELDGGPIAQATVRIVKSHRHTTMLSVIIHEGRKRQIRRMFAAVGYPVCKLKRIRVGSVRLGRLPEGQYRELNPQEIESLRRLVQLR